MPTFVESVDTVETDVPRPPAYQEGEMLGAVEELVGGEVAVECAEVARECVQKVRLQERTLSTECLVTKYDRVGLL